MQTRPLKGSIYILFATIIWGSTFVAQALVDVGPFTFQGVRSIIGAIFLAVLVYVLDTFAKKKGTYKPMSASEVKELWKGGVVCGVVLCAAMNLQQFGMHFDTDPGKAGFITAMYILIVPVLGLFMKKKVSLKIWFCIAIAVVGLFLLCTDEGTGLSFRSGDYFVLFCAFVFALHIIVVDYFVVRVDGVKLSLIQFLVAGSLSLILMFVFEDPRIDMIMADIGPILYAGIGSSGIAYTLQILGQKYTPPTLASLVMSFESVFAMVSEVVVFMISPTFGGGEFSLPTARNLVGCGIMFVAILLAQMPEKKKVSVN